MHCALDKLESFENMDEQSTNLNIDEVIPQNGVVCGYCKILQSKHNHLCGNCGYMLDVISDEKKTEEALGASNLIHVRNLVKTYRIGYFALMVGVILCLAMIDRMFGVAANEDKLLFHYFYMFTNITNFILTFWFISFGVTTIRNRKTGFQRFLSHPIVVAALTAYITVVNVIVLLLIDPVWNGYYLSSMFLSGGAGLFFTHFLSAIAMWIYFGILPKTRITNPFKKAAIMLIYPSIYCIFQEISGAFTGSYAYPFLDYRIFPSWTYIFPMLLVVAGVIYGICVFTIFTWNMMYKHISKMLRV